nr:hypothetical protein CFP56_56686 [Quercus suber]
MAEQVSLPNLVAAVEAIAASGVVTFAKEIGLNSIMLDGDPTTIIDFLKNDEIFVADYRHLIEKGKDIADSFAICGFLLLKDKIVLLFIILLDMLAILKCGWKHSSREDDTDLVVRPSHGVNDDEFGFIGDGAWV